MKHRNFFELDQLTKKYFCNRHFYTSTGYSFSYLCNKIKEYRKPNLSCCPLQ